MSYITKNLTEIKTNMIFNIISNITEINDANIGSILDMFITSISQEIAEQYEDLNTIYNGTRISTSTGDDLEELGLLVGITRLQGAKSSGFVSFIRNSPASSEFTILRNSLISTQPISGFPQYQFKVKENNMFLTSIENEEHTFINGIYNYKLNERFINSISLVDGLVSSVSTEFIANTDYILSKNYNGILEDITDFELIDDCSDDTKWVEDDYAAAPTDNTSIFYEGTSALNLIKTATDGNIMTYNIDFSAIDLTDNALLLRLYIKDNTALQKITNIMLYESDNVSLLNYYKKTYLKADLQIGWNLLYIDITDATVELEGIVDISNIITHRLQITTAANNNTFSTGDIVIDFLHKAKPINYIGDIISWDKDETIPDNETTFYINYVPLSKEIEVEATEIGSAYNVGINQLTFKITNIPQIDRINNYEVFNGGLNVETDDELRDRIQNASSAANVATLTALEFNLRSLPFISAVRLIEKPETTATEEVFVFDNSITNYALRQKVAINDDNLTIGDTTSSSDYIRNTDFALLPATNEISWIGNTPVDEALFFVNYHYNKLGYTTAFVVGRAGELTSSQIQEAQDLVDEKKAAGTIVNILQPTYIPIDIEATLILLSGYNQAVVISAVKNSLRSYFETLSVNDNVLLAEVIYYIMNVDGVKNCSIVDIGGGGAADYTIGAGEVARAGDLNIS